MASLFELCTVDLTSRSLLLSTDGSPLLASKSADDPPAPANGEEGSGDLAHCVDVFNGKASEFSVSET